MVNVCVDSMHRVVGAVPERRHVRGRAGAGDERGHGGAGVRRRGRAAVRRRAAGRAALRPASLSLCCWYSILLYRL